MKQQYSIADLLQSQPKAFKLLPNYALLNNMYAADKSLHAVVFSANNYRLLNRAKLSYSQLTKLCSRFRIKSNLFFALFVKYKQQYFTDTKKAKIQKQNKIENILSKMNADKKNLLKFFLAEEKKHNKKVTLWRKYFYILSNKKALFLCSSNNLEFYLIAKSYTEDFRLKYHADAKYFSQKLISFALELPQIPSDAEIIKNKYRILSKKYHPDIGGNSILFKTLVELYNQCLSLSTEPGLSSK